MCFPLLDVSEDIRNGKHSQETFKNKLNRKELGLALTKITVISNFTEVKAYVMQQAKATCLLNLKVLFSSFTQLHAQMKFQVLSFFF